MATTFIQLCNQTLRRLNEVEIPAADFPNVRGVQALVKDAVKASVAKIHQAEFEWPFDAAEHSIDLDPGRSEYAWPVMFLTPDWNSFQIVPSETVNRGYKALRPLDRDEWYKRLRDRDYSDADGVGMPVYVFPSHGAGFGVSPSPDQPYTLRYRYFLTHSNLVGANDITRVPDNFSSLIVDGAMYHMYMFRDNAESAQIAMAVFEQGLKHLQTVYNSNAEYIYDTRVQFGGGRTRRAFQ